MRPAGEFPVVRFPLSLGLTVGTIASANLLSHRVLPQFPGLPNADALVAVGLVGCLTVVARTSDLSAEDLGLARRSWGSGLRWGGIAAALVAAGYGIAALVPGVAGVVEADVTVWPDALFKALVVIPLTTVIPEEFAFRGVLWGLLRRQSGRRIATVVSSALFGLWHVFPALGGGAANESVAGVVGDGALGVLVRVLGTVLFTGLAGVLFCELRARSGSLLAPILLHWAVNGFGELFVLLG
jgi:membrane protease YdiL (CAAX protease family)